MANSGLTGLADLAYDAALAPARWSDFLRALAGAVGGASIGMSLRHPRAGDPGWVVFHETDPAHAAAYAERFFAIDPFRIRSATLAAGTCEVMAGGAIDARELARSEFYNEWMRPQGWLPAPSLGVTLERDDRGEPIGLGIFRPRGARRYGSRETGLLRALVPHLQRATRIARRVTSSEAQLAATTDALELLPAAALLVDGEVRVLRANHKALALLEQGNPVGQRSGRLLLPAAIAAAVRRPLVAHHTRGDDAAADARSADVLVRRDHGRAPLRVSIVPCSAETAGLEAGSGLFWILIEDPDDVILPSPSHLESRFGLTGAEARLCLLLLRGRRLAEAASELGVSPETVRTQLKSAFRKTGARSQADLVRLVLEHPALTLSDS